MLVFDDTGRSFSLTPTGRSGGEGAIHRVDGASGRVAKIFHAHKVTAELHEKVRAMAAAPPRDRARATRGHRSIAWVERVLYHDAARTAFAGFTMHALDLAVFREAHAYYDPADRIARFGGGFTWQHLMIAATNLASAVAAVHEQGHRVGDLRETNVLVSPTALVSLIDCDSFQVHDPVSGRTFFPRVGTGEYLPPELQGADFRADVDRTGSDRFALAVLVFKFLMLGAHPCQARGRGVEDAPSLEAKIAKRVFPYARARGVEPPAFAPPYAVLPPDLRALCERAFVAGARRPSKRPDAEEWFRVLRHESRRLRSCRANENHWFGRHQRACPWCALARSTSEDPFPSTAAAGLQRPATAPASRAAPAPRAPVHPPRAPVPAPAAVQATPAPPPAASPGRRFRMGVPSRRAIVIAASLAAAAGLLLSPLARADAEPVTRTIAWRTTLDAPCPYDTARASAPPAGCTGRWVLGPIIRTERRSRELFVLERVSVHLRVEHSVTYRARAACVIPWIDARTIAARAPSVCVGSCGDRIELRGRPGDPPAPLVDARGVAARDGSIGCNVVHRGSWTFDRGQRAGPLRLRHPAFADVTLPGRV